MHFTVQIRSTIILAILFIIHIAILTAFYDCNPRLYQSYYQPILLVEEHRYYSSREDRLCCVSSWALIRASTRAERAPFTALLTHWASQKRSLNLRNIIASNNWGVSHRLLSAITYIVMRKECRARGRQTNMSAIFLMSTCFSSYFNARFKIIDLTT